MSGSTVLVIGEYHDGKIRPITLELITAATQLARKISGEVVVAVFGTDLGARSAEVAAILGVDRILTVEHDALTPFLAGPWTGAVASVVHQVAPLVVLIPSSITGRDYASRVAARLGAGLVSDAVHLDLQDGRLLARRAVLGSRVQTEVTFLSDSLPAFVTVAPGSFLRAEVGTSLVPVESMPVTIEEDDRRVTLIQKTEHRAGAKGLTEAQRIVSGGRGLGKAENFALVEELAEVLNAAVGASGATVGAGWRSHSDQVGSTGHTVSPKLYLAVGISGAPQHLVGMSGSENIVAINRDPEAPILKIASFGIVGDLFEVVPALVRQLMEAAE